MGDCRTFENVDVFGCKISSRRPKSEKMTSACLGGYVVVVDVHRRQMRDDVVTVHQADAVRHLWKANH